MTAPASTPAPTATVGNTPVRRVRLWVRGRPQEVLLKLEQHNPRGSVKDRTAAGLLNSLEERDRLQPGGTVVESTSGNLGLALASAAQQRSCRFVAVVDPKCSPQVVRQLHEAGASIEMVQRADPTGGFLLNRLARVQELLALHPDWIWTDQYRNPANPHAHFTRTGPEILAQGGPRLGAVFVAVSTGGTLAGVGRYFRQAGPFTRVFGVDVQGSAAFGGTPGRWLINGIGSARPSHFLRASCYDGHLVVTDAQAVAVCQLTRRSLGLGLGGSSGAVLAACARHLARRRDDSEVLCLCPDGADRYEQSIYRPAWIEEHGIDVDVELRALGVDRIEPAD